MGLWSSFMPALGRHQPTKTGVSVHFPPPTLRFSWPADFRWSRPPLQLGFDGRPEAIGAEGMLPLQVQAHAVEFFLGDTLHDPCVTGLTALESACTKGEIIRVRPNQRVRQTQCGALLAKLACQDHHKGQKK